MSAAAYRDRTYAHSESSLSAVAGGVLMLAGGAFGSANLFQFGVMSDLLHLPPATLSVSWMTALMVFLVSVGRIRSRGGAQGRRAAVWSRLAIGFQVCTALGLLAASLAVHDFSLMFWTAPVGLATYGLGWSAAVVRGGRPWMAAPALGCLMMAALLTQMLGTPGTYLSYAIGLFAFVLLPGAWLVLAPKT